MKIRLKQKIMGLACVAALLPTVMLLALSAYQRQKTSAQVSNELNILIQDNVRQVVLDVYHTGEAAADLAQSQVDQSLTAAKEILGRAGEVGFTQEKVNWLATNKATGSAIPISLPKMTIGGKWLGQNLDPAVASPVVDEVTRISGAQCTVFQRMNERGDMLRVATNIETADHSRAVGTFIPEISADGSPDPIVAAVLRGETYHGRAFVVSDWYTSAYEPLRDRQGKTVGMLFVGVGQRRLDGLLKGVAAIKVGKTGSVFVLGGKNELKGRYLVPEAGHKEGESVWDARDAEGKSYAQILINKALDLKESQVEFASYLWKDENGGALRKKSAAIAYFQPWDWVIVASTYEDEFFDAHKVVNSALAGLFWWSAGCGLLMAGVALAIAFVLAGMVVRPLQSITSIAGQIAQGDLVEATRSVRTLRVKGGSPANPAANDTAVGAQTVPDDETGLLFESIRTMTQNLHSLVGQVKQSSIQLVSTSTEIAAASRQQEATVADFGTSTNEVVAATKEISATSRELVQTMNDVTHLAAGTASLAGSGRNGLVGMETTMRQLVDATKSISKKLAVISDKASNITTVVTTIAKVADETNLLSLNAAIEAEKAGEYGLGFSVVAREIRRLADQTAVATLDIEEMVKEMRSAVSAGVMEMDKFTEEVRTSVQEVSAISAQLGKIIEQVQSLTPRFDSVNSGMQVQAQGAEQISKAMVQLSDAARQTAESLREFNKATEQLNESARGLRSEVSRFRVNG